MLGAFFLFFFLLLWEGVSSQSEAERFQAMRLDREREEASRREAEKRERQQLVRAEVERLQEEKERRAKQLEYLRVKQEREDPLLSRAKAAEEEVDSALALLMKEMGDGGRPKETAHQHGKLFTDRDEGFSGGGGGSRGKVRFPPSVFPIASREEW